MIFYIILGLVIIAAIGWAIWGFLEDGFGFAFLAFICGAVVSATIGLAVFLGAAFVFRDAPTYSETTEATFDIRSVGNSQGVEGSYSGNIFISRGYVKDRQVINFIYTENGYSVLGSVAAKDSRIYEDDPDQPYLLRRDVTYTQPLIAPFTFGGSTTYDFHIPSGSVIDSYEIGVE